MKIAKIDISFIDTNDISINLWLPGCKCQCKGCFTPELKNFDAGLEVPIEDVINIIKRRFELTRTVCLLGGNPPDHKYICDLVRLLKENGAIIWVYSGYYFEDIEDKEWIKYCDYIKAGPYIEELKSKESKYASTNQKLWRKVNDKWTMENLINAKSFT